MLRSYNTDGVDILAEDWDNLLILDACRYDMFEKHQTLPGTLEHRISRESATTDFLMANFRDKEIHDTVYVTANPQLYRNQDRIQAEFHDVVNIWMEDGWDETEGTVLPETVTEYAKQAASDYPNKRLIVHYIQPHYPFIGADTTFDKGHLEGSDDENVWGQLMTGEIDVNKEKIWEVFTNNLEIALPAVESLMETLSGKTVVTADHGNMIGERSTPIPVTEWGHPRGTYTDQLVKVPWLTHENGNRRKVVSEVPLTSENSVDDSVVSERLRNLGYAE
ncbi:hypothetical protein [Halocatena halophila]|uniref:hypothetical protein n=1 Tax=Halocatena halophila TaxID=2814576 RepID=UPI002ED2A421